MLEDGSPEEGRTLGSRTWDQAQSTIVPVPSGERERLAGRDEETMAKRTDERSRIRTMIRRRGLRRV
jgi:hypothetical protein